MFYAVLQVATVMLTAFTAALTLAHAFEMPAKMRLDHEAYLIVQRIYYPGFTIGAVAEVGSPIAALLLLLLTPSGTPAFWLTLVAFGGLVATHMVYWIVIHPINRYWLSGGTLGNLGARFFAAAKRSRGDAHPSEWTALRDRWEYSHLARAVLTTVSLLALVISLVVAK